MLHASFREGVLRAALDRIDRTTRDPEARRLARAGLDQAGPVPARDKGGVDRGTHHFTADPVQAHIRSVAS